MMNLLVKPSHVKITYNVFKKNVSKISTQNLKTDPDALKKNLPIINPANGDLINELPCDSAELLEKKFQAASKAQKSWKNVPITEKKKIITQYGELLKENTEDLAKTLTSEMGKSITQARGEVKAVQGRISFFLENVESALQPRIEKEKEQVRYEPLGVIANISAWNYPYFVGNNVLIPALLTGNTILYKPSEYASLTGLKMVQLLHKAGIPKDVLSPIIGRGDIGENLIKKDINGVFFTGSNATGAKIAQQVGGKMIRLQLELGGKDPSYVREDADPKNTAASLADGAMYNTGQSCCSVERIYVHTKIYREFVEHFVNEVKTFQIGDPMNEKTYIGALALAKQPEFLENQVKDAVSKGAKVLIGGKKAEQPGLGNWFQPTVLVNVNHKMDVMTEESFGPIIGIQEVQSDEEAISLMNDTKYGLTAGVYTKSKSKAEEILPQINSGTVYWNACDRVSPCLPWSGRKGSGIGSTLGKEGIYAFVQPKAYHLMG